MANAAGTNVEAAAAGFDRPLLLTASQDLAGLLGRLLGKAFLTTIASLTILSVFLIFFFIFQKASPFFASVGVRLLVRPDNPVESLTREQVAAMYAGEITNWKEVGGPDEPVVLLGREAEANTTESFYKLIIRNWDEKQGKQIEGRIRHLNTDAKVQSGVQATRGAIGFVDREFEGGDGVKAIAVGGDAAPTRRRVWELFGSDRWVPTHEGRRMNFGALGTIYGSIMVTVGAMLIAVPLGLLAAVFLSDVVPFGLRQVIKPIIEILAAIPSVAYGFFAYLVIAPWLQNKLGFSTGTNALNASVMLAIMAVPTIVSISEDSLTAIGREMREGAYALGATRAEVLLRVIIPAAHSGIIAACILGVMRAVGETMLVWMAAGNATGIPQPWYNLGASVRTLTATIAAEMGEAPAGGVHRQALFTVGVLLLVMTFTLNLVSEYFLAKAKRAVHGKKGK